MVILPVRFSLDSDADLVMLFVRIDPTTHRPAEDAPIDGPSSPIQGIEVPCTFKGDLIHSPLHPNAIVVNIVTRNTVYRSVIDRDAVSQVDSLVSGHEIQQRRQAEDDYGAALARRMAAQHALALQVLGRAC